MAVRRAMESEDPADGTAMLSLAMFESCTRANCLEWFRLCGYM